MNTETGEAVAIKIIDKTRINDPAMFEQIKTEISFIKKIKHPYIINLKEVFETSEDICIVLEYIGGGSVLDRMAKQDGKLTEQQTRFYFKQLMDGLSYCHDKNVCHRDLKPEVNMWVYVCLFISLSTLYILYMHTYIYIIHTYYIFFFYI